MIIEPTFFVLSIHINETLNSTLTPQRRQEISNGNNEHSASARTGSVQMENSKQSMSNAT